MLTTIDDTPLERDHLHYPHHYEELRLLVEDWLTATTATPRRSRSRPGSSPATGPWWVVCTTATAAALTAGIPDLAFTPISLDSTAIEDLRASWSTPPSPPFAARER